jgi:pectin methylesterase-like acyl-CoA thioesterase
MSYLAFSLFLCTAVAAVVWFLSDSSAAADDSTRYVAPGGDCGGVSPCYATIQDAVDAASDGDTIKIAQGVYTSPGLQVVYIDRAVALTGGYTRTN